MATEDAGVTITPDPSGIVVKTRLMKEKLSGNESYVPPSLSSICAQPNDPSGSTGDGGSKQKGDTKVFLNICTHPLIAQPCKRPALDDETGKEIDGYRLPISVGELRPCYDKTGNAAIAADCVLNPKVVAEMNADSGHFQFVCDMIVQCASKKFGPTWFGGLELDRRFKLPKMKYAGYVDEATGLPVVPDSTGKFDGPKAAVAKQRVKGHGGKSPIIEEVASAPAPTARESKAASSRDDFKVDHGAEQRAGSAKPEFRIELFVSDGDRSRIPLLDFLRSSASHEGGNVSKKLRKLIQDPKLKPHDEDGVLHESQLLVTPVPLDVNSCFCSDSLDQVEQAEDGRSKSSDCWTIHAACSVGISAALSNLRTPTIELSALLLVLSMDNTTTECTLPFPIDTRRSSVTYNPTTGVLSLRMPLLRTALEIEGGPDPGTHQWQVQSALSGGSAAKDEIKADKEEIVPGIQSEDTAKDMFFLGSDNEEEDVDDTQPLPEDMFHSHDVLSQHLLKQQEEERKVRAAKKDQGRDEANVEYIDVNDFRQPRDSRCDCKSKSATMEKAEAVMKQRLQSKEVESLIGSLV
ncbi:hypothetical protein ACHAWF_014805 [Thalassiosira exigua]